MRIAAQSEVIFEAKSGDPVADYRSAIQFAMKNVCELMCSSSVDHFTMDGDDYDWEEDDQGIEWLVRSTDSVTTVRD